MYRTKKMIEEGNPAFSGSWGFRLFGKKPGFPPFATFCPVHSPRYCFGYPMEGAREIMKQKVHFMFIIRFPFLTTGFLGVNLGFSGSVGI